MRREAAIDTETYNCIRCGKTIDASAEYCPHCGLDQHPGVLDDAELPMLDNGPVIDRRSSVPAAIGGTLLGLICAGALPLMAHGWSPLALALSFPVAAVLGGSVAVLLHRRKMRPARPEDVDAALYQALLRRTGGDAARLERLVELEQTQAPGAARAELLRRALERLERDWR